MTTINPYRIPPVPKHLEVFHPWWRRDFPIELLEILYDAYFVKGCGVAWDNNAGHLIGLVVTFHDPASDRSYHLEVDISASRGMGVIWNLDPAPGEPDTFDPHLLAAQLKNAQPRPFVTLDLSKAS